jgi:peptide/nickel transport system permease protein
LGLALYLVVLACAVFPSFIAPHDPLKIATRNRLQLPSGEHWLGTDELGRDVLSRLVYGARVSILVGIFATGIAVAVGVPLGLFSAFYGRVVDGVIMRVMDALAAFPGILMAIVILSALGPGLRNAMIAIGINRLPAFSRLARGTVLSVKNNEYVEAARACGASGFYIMFRTILPNCVAPLLVHVSLSFATAILAEAALSFLGLGTQAPTPSWGAMLQEARQFMTQTVWYAISSGMAIFVAVLGLNLIGDGLRDVLDPRLRGR